MSYVVKGKSGSDQYALPKTGLHRAVCVDLYDAGYKDTQWGPKEQLAIVWELEEKHPDFDGPFRITNRYTPSFGEKALLRKLLKEWFGKDLTEKQITDGVDLEKLIGRPCLINVIHNKGKNGNTYANVGSVQPHDPRFGEALAPSGHYQRVKDRPAGQHNEKSRPYQESGGDGASSVAQPADEFKFEPDDDLPF